MSQKLGEYQLIEQTQQLSTLQIAVAKLMELPVTELAMRVQDEMLDNAALEEADDSDREDYDDHRQSDEGENGEGEETNDREETEPEELTYSQEERDDYGKENDAMSDYLSDDDVPEYLQRRADAERDRNDFQYADRDSFFDLLQRQIGEYDLNDHEREVLTYLIGSLDNNGFLQKSFDALIDEMEVYHGVVTTREELTRLLAILQRFEPHGIGARNLQECLLIQLEAPDYKSERKELAIEIVKRCFKDFMSKHWQTIKNRLRRDEEEVDEAIEEIKHLNPQPGCSLNDDMALAAPTVVPDFFVQVTSDGELSVTLNRGDVPELRVSPAFRDSIKQYGSHRANLSREQKDAYTYARKKVDSAMVFINLVQRRNQALLLVMKAIVDYQRAFFLADDDETLLAPMTLKDLADRTGINISSISRVTSSKYVQTLYGTYPLKFFFSSQFTSADGEELSSRKVKAALQKLLETEDKKHPLADERLAALLKAEGFNVARRTVAKYRDMLGFPTARLRKE